MQALNVDLDPLAHEHLRSVEGSVARGHPDMSVALGLHGRGPSYRSRDGA